MASVRPPPAGTVVTGPKIGIIMGSQSDWATLKHAAETLTMLEVPHESRIVSAHRTPDRLAEYARSARKRGLAVIIAGAGGAAHLPGMCAAWTALPVLGVPVESHALSGLDSLLSIVQMPAGIPVGSIAIGRRRPKASPIHRGICEPRAVLALGARRHDRHSGRRPAWPHVGHRGGAAGLPMPCVEPGGGLPGRPGCRWHHRRCL